ncbi:RNase adapter RapZ, partial [Kaarinaea lacus]
MTEQTNPQSESKPHSHDTTAMKLVVISGVSGSGKSTALNVLEDQGFY